MPKRKTVKKAKSSQIADKLRRAIRNSGRPASAIAEEAGYSSDVVTRFLHGRDSQLSTAERMAKAIGMRLELVLE
jgi:DNA-binding phage protein